jgi:hypothetical protein
MEPGFYDTDDVPSIMIMKPVVKVIQLIIQTAAVLKKAKDRTRAPPISDSVGVITRVIGTCIAVS